MQTARLGLVVGKKVAPRAVARNKIKRMIRERFRRLRSNLGAVDIVVRLSAPVAGADLELAVETLFAEIRLAVEERRK